MDDISQWTMPQEARESLRHYLSAAILFPGADRDSSVRARTVAAFDRWFALGDAVRPAAPNAQPVQPVLRDHRGEIVDVLCDDVFGETYESLQTEQIQPADAQYWGLRSTSTNYERNKNETIRALLDAAPLAHPVQPAPDNLKSAAQAVIDRWDSPQWKWAKQGPTGELMHDLRVALQKSSS